jgi:hypothetical protein
MNPGLPEEPSRPQELGESAWQPNRRLFGAVVSLAVMIGVGVGVYAGGLSGRLHEFEQRLQEQESRHEQVVDSLLARLEEAENEFAVIQGDLASAQNTLGRTQLDLRRTQVTAEKLAKEQRQTAEQLGALTEEQDSTEGRVGTLSSAVTGVRTDVSDTQQGLQTTRSQLQRVMGDLGVQSGLVAHNSADLAELRRRGEREYYEFDLRKTPQPQKYVGGVALQLKKTDVKRQRYTVDLIADDRRIEKKDKTANEPVQFYQAGNRIPTEFVVNQIYKDRIVGYISMPKQEAARLETIARPVGGGS